MNVIYIIFCLDIFKHVEAVKYLNNKKNLEGELQLSMTEKFPYSG